MVHWAPSLVEATKQETNNEYNLQELQGDG